MKLRLESPSLSGECQPIKGMGMEAGCPSREAAQTFSALHCKTRVIMTA